MSNNIENNVNKNETIIKALQLNINESSSSSSSVSSFSSTSSSTTTLNNLPSIVKETRNSCDDDLNNIKENINFSKINEKLTKIDEDEMEHNNNNNLTKTKNNTIDKLEKVGEAEPALNILCKNKNIKFCKIERLVNEATHTKNGQISSDDEDTKHKTKILKKLKNGHHNDESDGQADKVSITTTTTFLLF